MTGGQAGRPHRENDFTRAQRQAEGDRIARALEQRDRDFLAVMQTAEGRRFVSSLLEASGVFDEPCDNSGWTNYRLGKAALGRPLLKTLLTPEFRPHFVLLLQEQDVERKRING